MKIIVDFDLCKGHATCMGEAPEIFHVSDDGVLTLLQSDPPDSLRQKAEAAATYCPAVAIRIAD